MDFYSDYDTNVDKEKEGIWVQYEGYALLIARAGGRNARYTQAMDKAMKPHRKGIAKNKVSNRALDRAMAPVFAKFVLLDWKNVTTKDGSEVIPYSVEKALELFQAMPDFLQEVRDQSGDQSNYQDTEGTEEAAGNS